MPHFPIILLKELRAIFDQLDGYADTVHDNLEAEQYTGSQVAEAEQLLEDMSSLATTINTNHRSALDTSAGAFETFLGI